MSLCKVSKARPEPLSTTRKGDTNAVLQDEASYKKTQEPAALLKILVLGNQDVEAGKVKPLADVVARLRGNPAAP